MFTLLFKKEIRQAFLDTRYHVYMVFTFLLITTAFINQLHQYLRQHETYTFLDTRLASDYTGGKADYLSLASAGIRVPVPPCELQMITRGAERYDNKQIEVSRGTFPFIDDFGEPNVLRKYFTQQVDVPFIVVFILSLMALVYAHTLISEEKEYGTLRLLLANTISRTCVLLVKFVAGFVCTIFPVAVAFAVMAGTLWFHPAIELGMDGIVGFTAAFALTAVLLMFFFVCGTFIALVAPTIATSIALQITFWIITVVVVHNLTAALLNRRVNGISEVSSHELFYNNEIRRINGVVQEECEQFVASHSGGGSVTSVLLKRVFAFQLGIYADEYSRAIGTYSGKMNAFAEFAGIVALASPTMLYSNAMATVCKTDISAHLNQLGDAARYYRWFMGHMRKMINERIEENRAFIIGRDKELEEMVRFGMFAAVSDIGRGSGWFFGVLLLCYLAFTFMLCVVAMNRMRI